MKDLILAKIVQEQKRRAPKKLRWDISGAFLLRKQKGGKFALVTLPLHIRDRVFTCFPTFLHDASLRAM